jgi:hypothetical protein
MTAHFPACIELKKWSARTSQISQVLRFELFRSFQTANSSIEGVNSLAWNAYSVPPLSPAKGSDAWFFSADTARQME